MIKRLAGNTAPAPSGAAVSRSRDWFRRARHDSERGTGQRHHE